RREESLPLPLLVNQLHIPAGTTVIGVDRPLMKVPHPLGTSLRIIVPDYREGSTSDVVLDVSPILGKLYLTSKLLSRLFVEWRPVDPFVLSDGNLHAITDK